MPQGSVDEAVQAHGQDVATQTACISGFHSAFVFVTRDSIVLLPHLDLRSSDLWMLSLRKVGDARHSTAFVARLAASKIASLSDCSSTFARCVNPSLPNPSIILKRARQREALGFLDPGIVDSVDSCFAKGAYS